MKAVYLENDAASGSSGAMLGGFPTLTNSQCSVNPAASTVSLSGNTLTLNLAVTFNAAYSGTHNVYLRAVDIKGGNSGWQSLGTWTVP